MKLSFKLGLKTALVAGGIAVCIAFSYSYWEGKTRQLELETHANTVADMMGLAFQEALIDNDFVALNKYLTDFKARRELTYVVVYDSMAAPLASTGGPAADRAVELYRNYPKEQKRAFYRYSDDKIQIYEIVTPFTADDRSRGRMQIGFDQDLILAASPHKFVSNYLILWLGLLMSLVSGWLAARFLGKPIEAVIEGAEHLVESNYEHRINIPQKDELGRLVSSFNQMAGTIRQNMVELESRNRQLLKTQERQLWLARVAEQVGEGVMVCDLEGIQTFVNHSWAAMHGYTPEQLLGQHISISHSHAQLEREVIPFNQKVFEQGLNAGVVGHIKKDRTVFYTDMTTTLLKNADGKPLGFIGVARDITDQKKAQDELKKERDLIKSIFAATPDAVFITDLNGNFTEANEKALGLLGLSSRTEVLGKNISAFIAPEDQGTALHNSQKTLDYGGVSNIQLTMVNAKNERFPLEFSTSLLRSFDGHPTNIVSVGRNIFLRKKAELDLRINEERFRNIFTFSPMPMALLDSSFHFNYTNAAFNKMLGYTESEILKLTFQEITHPDHINVDTENVRRLMQGEIGVYKTEKRYLNKEKKVVWGDVQVSILHDDKGRFNSFIAMVSDITERKALEEILQTSEAQYRTTIDSIGDAIHVVDTELNILLANAVFKDWCLRLDLVKEPAGHNVFEVCPFLSPEVRQQYLQVFETGQTLNTQETNTVSGEQHITETRKIPIIEDGRVTKVITVMRDITQEKEAVRKLAESELKYQQVLEGVAEGIYRTTPEGKILLANQAIVKMLGYASLDELMSRDIKTEGYVDPDDHRSFVVTMNREGQVKNWVSQWKKKDGSILVARENAHVVRDDLGKIIYYEGTVQDMTDQLRAEQKLVESEKNYHQIFENIVEGIYRTTPEGKLLLANPALIRMLGFGKLEDMIKLDLNKSGYLNNTTRQRFKEIMERDGQVIDFESQWKRPDDKIITISENARTIRDDQGNVLFYEGTIEDITAKQRAEEALLSEKNKLSDLFRVSLQVARAGDIQKKIDLTMEGIAGTEMFARAVLVLKNGEGRNSHIAHFGMTNKEVQAIFNAGPTTAEKLEKIFDKKFRYSNSYFIPHDAQQVQFSIKLVSKKLPTGSDWHPDDVLLVPLMIKDKHIGYLTVDGPADGKIPNLETVRLLELFANQAAVALENMQLYQDLERSYYSTLKAFVAAMDAKDPYTKGHSENVRLHALNIARLLKLPEEQVRLIDFSSLLHDIGKLAIRDEILTKPSLLSDHEYQEVKLHPVIGSHLVSEVESLINVAPIIHSHHEHYDGSGYPQGIKGDKIPLESRIIAVADAFEAMTSDRPYRKAFDFHVAIKRLQEAAGTQFDNEIVSVFIKYHQKTHG